jgi:hypothetical protein
MNVELGLLFAHDNRDRYRSCAAAEISNVVLKSRGTHGGPDSKQWRPFLVAAVWLSSSLLRFIVLSLDESCGFAILDSSFTSLPLGLFDPSFLLIASTGAGEARFNERRGGDGRSDSDKASSISFVYEKERFDIAAS